MKELIVLTIKYIYLVYNTILSLFLDPPCWTLDGGSYVISSVSLCIKLAQQKRFKVTKPEFRKEKVLAHFWAQIRPKMSFLDNISRKNHCVKLQQLQKMIRGTIAENFRSRKKLVLKISSHVGFGHARAAFGQTRFSPVWYMLVT